MFDTKEAQIVPEIWKQPQNSRRHNGGMKHVAYSGSTNTGRHCTKYTFYIDLTPGTCAPLLDTIYVYDTIVSIWTTITFSLHPNTFHDNGDEICGLANRRERQCLRFVHCVQRQEK
jgi:hypothetical protein